MLKFFISIAASFLCFTACSNASPSRIDIDEFVKQVVLDHGFKESKVRSVLADAEYQDKIIELITRPAEAKPWIKYRDIFLQDKRRDEGVIFLQEHIDDLERAELEFGVSKHVIVAILGVETSYGKIMGSYPVVDSLYTLGFGYPRRAGFFRSQLSEFLLLACEERIQPFIEDDDCRRESHSVTVPQGTQIRSLMGSYAGAMGFGQFIPSSYRDFAIDFDGDGTRDIWTNVSDAIGSIGNYFQVHGWDNTGVAMVKVQIDEANSKLVAMANDTLKPETTLAKWRELGVTTTGGDGSSLATLLKFQGENGPEWFLGFHNFYVISRYNISRLYSRVIWELAEDIKTQS